MGESIPQNLIKTYAQTDLGNADWFVDNAKDLRFCPDIDAWLYWDGKAWTVDATRMAIQHAKKCVRALEDIKWSEESQMKTRLLAMVELAKSEPSIQVRKSELDADNWLLNTPTGIINLRTYDIIRHDRQLVSRCTNASIQEKELGCPAWESFLSSVQDAETIDYLQEWCGYLLTGDTSEQQALFHIGEGGNGKGVFLSTLAYVLGSYAIQADFRTFMENGITDPDKPRSDLVRLEGARAIFTSELDKGKKLSEALFKTFTGEDPISVRELHGKKYEFQPVGKLWLFCNALPVISGQDRAVWRRVRVIDWKVNVTKPDPNLKDKLKLEADGILQWMLLGLQRWRCFGLKPPQSVLDRTATYKASADWLGLFLSECTVKVEGAKLTKDVLFSRYQAWAKESNEFIVSKRKLGIELLARGLKDDRDAFNRYWLDIGLSVEPD